MLSRLTFFGITAFWVTMNVLLWRTEFGSLGGDTPVPLELVWRKILTAPDESNMSVYRNQERTGYAEFSTGVGQSMAALDEDKLPPDGLAKRAGYVVRLSGNVALGDFTNRMKFTGFVRFTPARRWQELSMKIITRLAVVELESTATNRMVHVKISGDTVALERDLSFDDLQNPNALVHAFLGNFADAFLGTVDLPILPATAAGDQNLSWSARRTRVKIGSESVPIYRLETSALGHPVTVDVSTLGDILRLELPGGISVRLDEWSKP